MSSTYEFLKHTGPVPSVDEMKNVLRDEGYNVYEWSDAAGVTYDFHQHETDQSHWIVSGAMELTVDGSGTFLMTAGDRDLMPAGTRHAARVVGDQPVMYLIAEK
jgi:quercetin dioxygenase-like cupin family protein